jgi:hypothetical protein
VKGAHAEKERIMERKDRLGKDAEEALDEARRDAAGRTIEDQGAQEGDLTETTHGREDDVPTRREGEAPPSD